MSQDQTPSPVRPEVAAPPAQHQVPLPPADILHSANSGVVVRRAAQARAGSGTEARAFLRELANRINTKLAGQCCALVYEETFGVTDRLHLLTHMTSLDGYYALRQLAKQDGAGDDAERWNRLFTEGATQQTVLLPQFWGMYGAKVDGVAEKQSTVYRGTGAAALPPARQQTSQATVLDSASAGIVMHRTGQMVYDFRSEARQFAREVAESINKNLEGECTVFVFEEAFGTADRIHWLIHLKDMSTYMKLLALHVRDEEVRELYFRPRLAEERGGGTWARMFTEGSMVDTAMTPLS